MICILDTSVVLRMLLGESTPLREWGRWERAYWSEIAGVEARRTFDRLRVAQALNDSELAIVHEEFTKIESAVGRIPVNRSVLNRASLPLPVAVRTLDAIHLASALLLREQHLLDLTFATHDVKQAQAARTLGFSVIGVTFE